MISIMRKEKLIILSISSERERIVIAFAKKFLGVPIPAQEIFHYTLFVLLFTICPLSLLLLQIKEMLWRQEKSFILNISSEKEPIVIAFAKKNVGVPILAQEIFHNTLFVILFTICPLSLLLLQIKEMLQRQERIYHFKHQQ